MSATESAGFRPSGIFAAVVTPFRADEALDEDRLGSHLEYLLEAGIHGVVPIGGSGEFVSLSMAERFRVIELTVRAVAGRVPVVVGALAPSTHEVLEVGACAARAGADALLVLPPYYIRPSLAGVVDHFARAAAETGLPVVAYNNPPRTGFAIGPAELAEIAAVPGVVAVKDCDRDVAAIAAKVQRVGRSIAILGGDDDLVLPALLAGADGAIMAAPNLSPRLCLDLYAAYRRGDLEASRALQDRLLPLINARKIPNHPGPLKEMMAMAGRSVGRARRPLVPMTASERATAAAALEAAGNTC
jgi:4-hydroxy-tetrahydrodipicolinate synthase